jgi:hypothetical protein
MSEMTGSCSSSGVVVSEETEDLKYSANKTSK